MLSPRQILDGLDDRFRLLASAPTSSLWRHQTLSASLDWSYELIDDAARTLLRLLSAASDWPLDAVKPAWRLSTAGNRLHEALTLQIEHTLRPDALDTLEALAELQIGVGRPAAGARLLGAAERARANLGLCRLPERTAHFAQLREWSRRELGAEDWAAELNTGLSMTLDEVLQYARRERGPRATAHSGLASLTPAERSVAEIAAQGLTNADIAARLFMSPHTVKAHLAHAYEEARGCQPVAARHAGPRGRRIAEGDGLTGRTVVTER